VARGNLTRDSRLPPPMPRAEAALLIAALTALLLAAKPSAVRLAKPKVPLTG
jgi:hypothetical protein